MNWELVVQLSGFFIQLVFGFGGIVPVVAFLRDKIGTSPRQSQALTVLICVLVTVANMIVQNTITAGSVTTENATALIVAVLAASQAEYQRVSRIGDEN